MSDSWKLRRAVKAINEVLASLRLEKHPDKTFIGRIENGFDFLGYHFGAESLSVAKQTLVNFIDKASRLYEQERSGTGAPDALGMYVRRWVSWAEGGLVTEKTPAERGSMVVYTWCPALKDAMGYGMRWGRSGGRWSFQ